VEVSPTRTRTHSDRGFRAGGVPTTSHSFVVRNEVMAGS